VKTARHAAYRLCLESITLAAPIGQPAAYSLLGLIQHQHHIYDAKLYAEAERVSSATTPSTITTPSTFPNCTKLVINSAYLSSHSSHFACQAESTGFPHVYPQPHYGMGSVINALVQKCSSSLNVCFDMGLVPPPMAEFAPLWHKPND
jgi:hypothetical protein